MFKQYGRISLSVYVQKGKIFMEGCIIAFDVSKGNAHYQSFLSSNKHLHKPKKIRWNRTDFELLEKDISKLKEKSGYEKVSFVYESTGVYSLPLEKYLKDKGYDYYVISPLLSAKFRQTELHSNKTDPLDCKNIAMVYYNRELYLNSEEDSVYEQLRALNRYYEDQMEHIRKYKVTLRSYIDSIMPDYDECFPKKDVYTPVAMEILRKYPHPDKITKAKESSMIKHLSKATGHDESFIRKYVERVKTWASNTYSGVDEDDIRVSFITELVNDLEFKIRETDNTLKMMIDLAKKTPHFEQIVSIVGIGENLASRIIAELGDMKKYTSKNQIVSYAGLDPMIRQSGKYDGDHLSISKKGNKRLRCILYLAVVCNLRQAKNDSIHNFYQKKRQQTNPLKSKAAKIACAHKLLVIIYGLCKTQNSYEF